MSGGENASGVPNSSAGGITQEGATSTNPTSMVDEEDEQEGGGDEEQEWVASQSEKSSSGSSSDDEKSDDDGKSGGGDDVDVESNSKQSGPSTRRHTRHNTHHRKPNPSRPPPRKRPRGPPTHRALRAATGATTTTNNDSGLSGAQGGTSTPTQGIDEGDAGAVMEEALFSQLESFVQVLESELPTVEVTQRDPTTTTPAPWGPGTFYATTNPDAAGRKSVLLALPMLGADPPVYRVVRPHTGLQVKLMCHEELTHDRYMGCWCVECVGCVML